MSRSRNVAMSVHREQVWWTEALGSNADGNDSDDPGTTCPQAANSMINDSLLPWLLSGGGGPNWD